MRFVDKGGNVFEVVPCKMDHFDLLYEMYEFFIPKGKFQGVPPISPDACRDWIGNLVRDGENFIAFRKGRVIGHVVVIPDAPEKEGEYLIFVRQDERNRGVGTRLTREAITQASKLGLKRLWLSVGTYNFPAIALYRKFGFFFNEDDRMESERTMNLIIKEEQCG
jgi:ribosomal protein S18 acetylase RimI-like enzyme